MKIEGTRAVVTGGGSGIGLALATALAEAGSHVTITGRNEDKLVRAAASHERIDHAVCDVTDDAAILALRERLDGAGGCDLLVNNAGVMHRYDVTADFSLDRKLQEVAIDASGPVRMVHHFLPGMLTRSSTIVNVSSGLAFVPFAQAPVYSGTKAFLHAYTQSLRAQLAGTTVRVVELMPPVVATEMVDDLDPSFPRMPPETLAAAFMKGLRGGNDEIAPGQSSQLRVMRRLAPGFIFGQLNKQPRP